MNYDNETERNLYPLKFKPILKDKIWGGKRLREILNKSHASDKCGESWEISGVPEDISVVNNGWLKGNTLEEIIEIYMADLVGDKVFEQFGTLFPLLIKFIDANDDLSIQVHPNDETALERHKSFGKTEMWYIIEAEKNSKLVIGFNSELSKEEYLNNLKNGTLEKILNYEFIQSGDIYYMPAGRVHAICAGILLVEIQQTSDITYRIYDYNRIDENGNQRELHTEFALEAIDFQFHKKYKTEYDPIKNKSIEVVDCNYFKTDIIDINNRINKDYSLLDSFIIFICTEGKVKIEYSNGMETLQQGETILIPAILNEISIEPYCPSRLLEVYI